MTKNSPGAFDYLSKAAPDEPMFILLGRDPTAARVLSFWTALRVASGLNQATDEQIKEAQQCVGQMDDWARNVLNKGEKVNQVWLANIKP